MDSHSRLNGVEVFAALPAVKQKSEVMRHLTTGYVLRNESL